MNIYKNNQRGIALIEFTFTILFFLIFFIGVIEIARLMYIWNTANEAARISGRMASICEISSAQHEIIRNKTQYLIYASGSINQGSTSWLQFEYYPPGCDQGNCQFVKTTVQDIQVSMFIPLYGSTLALPPVTYTTVRELLSNQMGNSDINPTCLP